MKKILIISFISAYLFQACDPIPGKSCAIDFDQEAMLVNYADQLIIPVLTDFKEACDSLDGAMDQFALAPDVQSLITLRNQLQQTWLKWQFVAHFHFGPVEDEELRPFLNNFPVFSQRVEQTLDSSSYNLSDPYYAYSRGFPAIEYLVYGTDTNSSQTIDRFTTDSNCLLYTSPSPRD